MKKKDIVIAGYSETKIEFKSGRHVYQYFDVPPQIHNALMAAQPHPGTFLASNIKGRFRYARVS